MVRNAQDMNNITRNTTRFSYNVAMNTGCELMNVA